jgi:hypothetical protein
VEDLIAEAESEIKALAREANMDPEHYLSEVADKKSQESLKKE